jgi:hypothetical protein
MTSTVYKNSNEIGKGTLWRLFYNWIQSNIASMRKEWFPHPSPKLTKYESLE